MSGEIRTITPRGHGPSLAAVMAMAGALAGAALLGGVLGLAWQYLEADAAPDAAPVAGPDGPRGSI